ncbi:MAG: hypothetical protein HW421_135 [Ignavibacteria bacterium]|nr:hypothetical protein [Ignavibacteria bacterium]
MKKKFNFISLILSIPVGLVLVVSFSWASGNQFQTPFFPILALLSGFIITGAVIGIISKEVTILEPGIGSILVAIISYFIITSLGLNSLNSIYTSQWVIILMNAVVLTFIGAWLGEKLQHGIIDPKKSVMPTFDWSWVLAGTLLGLTSSIVLINLLTMAMGLNPTLFYIPYFLTLLITGIIIGWMSPGVTVIEAGLAGFLTITIGMDILMLTLMQGKEIELTYIILFLVTGFVVTIIGGFLGEKVQSSKEEAEKGE